MIICPFHYEVRFKLIAVTNENEINPQFAKKIFINDDPIINRNKAFEVFEEFLAFKEEQLLIKNNNKFIWQPIFIKKQINNSGKTLEERTEWREKFEKFKEEFEIYLVIDDKEKLEEANVDLDREFMIHRVASYDFDPQIILDNLMNELWIYEYFGYETDNKKITIEYYGEDYYSAGEDPSNAFVEILETPFVWDSDKEKADEELRKFKLINSEESSDNIFERIIRGGETNSVEFKSSLLYNFKTNKAGASIKYIIAKSICGLLNSKDGGLLFIGVRDDKQIQGLEFDFSLYDKNYKDKFCNEFDSLIQYYFPLSICPFITTDFIKIEEKEIFVIQIEKNPRIGVKTKGIN